MSTGASFTAGSELKTKQESTSHVLNQNWNTKLFLAVLGARVPKRMPHSAPHELDCDEQAMCALPHKPRTNDV